MKEDLTVKGTQGYEHTSTKVASYVSECKGSKEEERKHNRFAKANCRIAS